MMPGLGLAAACLWVLVAAGCALLPRQWHWRAAWGLMVAGIPVLGLVTWLEGPVWGFVALACGMSVLRWPLFRAGNWLRRRVGRRAGS